MSFWARVFRARTFRHALPVALILLLLPGPTLLRDPTPRLLLAPAPAFAQTVPPPNPTLLPVATTAHVPLTLAYNAMNVPAKSAGSWYLDPTTNVKIYKLTSATFPTASPNWGHDYSEGGDEVSLPYNGNTRAVLVRQNGGPWWLIDFTPGVGVNNPRQLTGNFAPIMDLAFTFSNNPATPYYAYVSRGGTIYRFDIRTMTEAPGAGWPVTGETSAMWLHQSENDSFFVWMRGANGSTIVGYEPSTTTKKTYTNTSLNEPRIDRAGRYVGLSLAGNALSIWDWQTDTVVWSAGGAIPFAHQASLKRQWLGVNWNEAFPPNFTQFKPDVPNSARLIGKPANGHLIHGNGNWIQSPANLDDQWALFTHYGSLVPDPTWAWLAPGGMIFITANGQRRLLGHPYNTTSNYTFFSFAKSSPDGRYVLLTSDMNGSGRSDVFLAELPTSGATDTTPPTVSLTAPANGATVSGAAVTVAASASDNVGVIGVQFQLDGVTLGTEDTSAPFSSSWNTTLVSNGPHTLTAVARDAAGNTTTSGAIIVTVSNAVDTTPPVISAVALSSVTSSGAAIIWTTNEPADSQVEYGLTTTYGSVTPIDTSLLTAHAVTLNGLATGILYHYRVKSRDAAGNLAASADLTFTTLQPTIDTGVVGYWKFNEGSGTAATDSSGNGNTGTLVNGPAWVAINSNPALSFDGVDDYVNIPHAAALNAYPLTVAVWMKTNSTTGVRGIVNKYVAASNNGWNLFLNNGNLCAWYLRDGSNRVYDGGACPFNVPVYNDNQWHHVVYVVDAAGGRLYVDGTQKASLGWSGVAGAPSTTQPVRIGHYPGAFGGEEYFPGVLDEVAIYNRALSAAEVSALSTAITPSSDTTTPSVSVTAPSTGETVSGPTTVSASASDNVGVTGVQFKLDGANLGAEDTTAPYDIAWSTTTAPDGSHILTAVARDAAGNMTTSAAVTVTVRNDVTPPTVSITAPLAGVTVSGTVSVAASASDNVAVTGVQFTLDGVNLGPESTAAPYTFVWNTTTVPNGLHSLTAVARDAAGNTAAAAALTVTVTNDTSAPVLSGVAASVTSSGAIITWTTDEPSDSQVEYGLTTSYGAVSTLDTSKVAAHAATLSGLAAGTLYHHRVRSRDAAGNLAISGDLTFTTVHVLVYRSPVPVTLDGLLTEWGSATRVTFNGKSNSATAYLLWDPTYLYVAFSVTDAVFSVFQTTRDAVDLYQDDTVEIYIDTRGDRAQTMQVDDYQFLTNLLNVQGDLQGTGTGKNPAWNGSWSSTANAQGIKQGTTYTGYVVEVAIPWSQIAVSPLAGLILGMDLAVDDRDGAAFDYFDWAGIAPSSFAQPALWMQIQLVDLPAAP